MSNENYRLMAVEICHAFGSSNVDAMASILPHMKRSERNTILNMARTLNPVKPKEVHHD